MFEVNSGIFGVLFTDDKGNFCNRRRGLDVRFNVGINSTRKESMTITELKSIVSQRRGKLDYLAGEKNRVDDLLRTTRLNLTTAEQARLIIQHVSQVTQTELEYHVSELVSLAMSAVFPEPYKLKLVFKLLRGKSEASLQFERDGMVLEDPTMESGGGVVDVAAFALRVSLWSLAQPRSRATIVLDEPLRFLSRDLQPAASEMIKELSRRLNLQFLIITHEPNLLSASDRVFEVSMKNGVSLVETNKGGQNESDH